jgi:hypothetical protein
MAGSYTAKQATGQDPIRSVSPEARNVSPEVAESFIVPEWAKRSYQRGEVLKQFEKDPRRQLYDNYIEQFKLHNKSVLQGVRAGMPDLDMQNALRGLERVPIEEADEQAMLDMLWQIQGEVQEVDPSFSVNDDPYYAKMARSLGMSSPELAATTPAEAEGTSAIGRTGRAVGYGLTEGVTQMFGQVSDGFVELGFAMLGGLDSDYYQAWRDTKGPDKFLLDKDGRIVNNGGKIGRMEAPYLTFQLMTGLAAGDIQREANKFRDTVEWDRRQVKQGAETYANAIAGVTGGLAGFVATGGGALLTASTKLMGKGAGVLLAGTGPRTQAIGRVLTGVGGLSLGTAVWEMGMYGQAEGYGKAFMEGMKMGPVFWVAGKMGRGLERALATRKRMPKRARDFFVGAMEGTTISASELADLSSSLWRFMRNPEDQDAQAEWVQGLVGNLIGMGLYKAATGHTPFEERQIRGQIGEEGLQGVKKADQEGAKRRKDAAKGKEPGKAALRHGAREKTFKTYSERMEAFQRATGQERAEISAELEGMERQMDAERAGKDLTPEERVEANLEIRRKTMEELKDLPQEKKVDEIIDRLLGPKGIPRYPEPKKFAPKVKPSAEKQMFQEGGKEGLEPELPKGPSSREAAKEEQAGRDPLEDPDILRKLSPDQFADIVQRRSGRERRIAAEKYLGPERRFAERRAEEPTEQFLEAEEVPEPRGGQPKSMRIQPHLQVEPVEGAKDVRRSDILKLMEGFGNDPVKVPIRKDVALKGRTSTKGIMGWFQMFGNQIRLKGARDIVTAAHEWSHAFDQQAEQAKQWSPKMTEQQLKDAEGKPMTIDIPATDRKTGKDYMKTIPYTIEIALLKTAATYPGIMNLPRRVRIAEGWAEFWAREILADPILVEEGPELHKWMMELISKPGMSAYRRQFDGIREAVQNWINIGALRRGRMAWKGEKDKPTEVEKRARIPLFQRFKSAFSKYMLDDVAPLKEAERKWFKHAGVERETIPMAMMPTRLLDAFRMTATNQAKRLMNEGTFDVTGKRTGEGLKQITEEIGPERVEDFTTYILARRVIDQTKRSMQLIMQGKISKPIEMPIHLNDAREIVRQLENPDFIDAAERVRQWANRVLDYAVEAGSISEAERAAMIESNPVYIPFQRVLEGAARIKPGRGVAERGTGIGRLRGAQEEVRDPWAAMHDVTLGIVTKAQQSMVMRAMYLQSQIVPGMGGFVTEIPRKKRPQKIMLERLQEELQRLGKKRGVEAEDRQALEDMIELVAGGSPDAALTFFFQQSTPSGSRPIIAFKPNFTPEFVDSLPISPRQKMNLLARSEQLTWLEVDAEAYGVLMGIDAPKLFLDNAPKYLRNIVMAPTRMVRFGATQFNPEFVVRNMIRDPLTRQLFTREGSNIGGPLSGFAAMFKGAAEHMKGTEGAELFENMGLSGATLFGTEMGRELGREPGGVLKAARAAGDFLSSPEKWLRTKEFTDTYDRLIKEGAPEFEAVMQATLAAKEVTVNFTRAGVLARQMNQFLPYFSPQIAGKRKFWRAVTGHEGPEIQKNAILRGMLNLGGMSAATWFFFADEDWYQDLPAWRRISYWNVKINDQIISIPKPFEPGVFFGTGTELALQALNEHDPALARETALTFFGDHMVGYPFIPAGILPFAEAAADYSFFRDQNILPRYMSTTRLPKDQYTIYTSEMAKAVGSWFNVSPAKLEYVFDQYTGGIVRQFARLGESVAGLREAETVMSKMPFIGTMFRQTEHKQSRAVDDLYEAQSYLRQKKGSGEFDLADQRLQDQVNAAISRIQELRRNKRLSQDEIARRAFRIADPVVTKTRKQL